VDRSGLSPGNGWRIEVSGSAVRGTAWLEITIAARVAGDTITGDFGNERTPNRINFRLVRSRELPTGYVDLSIRGATTLDYREVPGRFRGSSQSGFYLTFATARRVPNVLFLFEGAARPAVGKFSMGPGSTNPYHATGGAGGGSLTATSGTLTITRSTGLAITGSMRYESVDPVGGARTTVTPTFDLPCTDKRNCRP
jgi:hypothetical protein